MQKANRYKAFRIQPKQIKPEHIKLRAYSTAILILTLAIIARVIWIITQ